MSFVAPYRVAADRPEYDPVPSPAPRAFDVCDMLATARRAADAEEVAYAIDAPDDAEGSMTRIQRGIVTAFIAAMLPVLAIIWGYLFFRAIG